MASKSDVGEGELNLYTTPNAIETLGWLAKDKQYGTTMNYAAEACTVNSPFFEHRPFTLRGAVGKPSTYTLTVRNEDSAQCGATTFVFSSPRTSDGWGGTFESQTLTSLPVLQGRQVHSDTPARGGRWYPHDRSRSKAPRHRWGLSRVLHCTVPHTIKPGPATNPFPAPGAKRHLAGPVLKWTRGERAAFHRVFFGTTNPPPFVSGSAINNFSPGLLEPETQYFWRIEEKNDAGTDDTRRSGRLRRRRPFPGKPRRDRRASAEYPNPHAQLKWRVRLTGGRPHPTMCTSGRHRIRLWWPMSPIPNHIELERKV